MVTAKIKDFAKTRHANPNINIQMEDLKAFDDQRPICLIWASDMTLRAPWDAAPMRKLCELSKVEIRPINVVVLFPACWLNSRG